MTYPDMPGREAVEMMKRCSIEIKDLRAAVARLQPKADAYDNLAIVLGLLPRRSEGMSPDIAWQLDKRIAELKDAATKAEAPTTEGQTNG